MKKIVFLISAFCLAIHPLYSQIIINNDTTVCSLQAIDLHALNSDPSSVGQDDQYDSIRAIGFNFEFYGITYTKCVISENGYITFDTSVVSGPGPWPTPYSITAPIPNPGLQPENAIMAPWHDLYINAGGNIYFGATGVAPNRMFLVTWCLVPMFGCNADLYTAQIVLNEGSNKIEMFIKDKPLCITWNGGAAVQGLVDATSTNSDIVADPVLLLPRNFPLTWTATNEGWEFIPNGTTSYTINPVPYFPIIAGAVTWTDSVGNVLGTGSSVSVNPAVTSTYFATMISNCSGTLEDSIKITVDVSNNSFDTIYADSMVFNPADTGVFVNHTFTVSGCDTAFVDSVVHQKLGVQINYNINNPGTATFTIDGTVQAMPYSQNYWAGETISIIANMQPNWFFKKWRAYSNSIFPDVNSLTASFVANSSDSCVLVTDTMSKAFISGSYTICDNANRDAEVKIYFSGAIPPFTFAYAINGVSQPLDSTVINPYIIYTQQAGTYTLQSYNDANGLGTMVGSAIVNIVPAPKAIIHLLSDTLSVLYPEAKFISQSVGNNLEQIWNFGDNSGDLIADNPKHHFPVDQFGRGISSIYEAKLVVTDDRGCRDTAFRQIWIGEEYYMYVPNSFTPDLDGKNDKFCISYSGVREETFSFNLYTRFSELVYSTNNINDLRCIYTAGHLINGWDGKHQLTGKDLPIGSYIFEIYYQDFEGWKHQDKGKIVIIR